MWVVLYSLYHGFARKPLKVIQQQGRTLPLYAPEDQMYVIGHDAPGYYFHAFLLLVKRQAIEQYVPVLVSCKNVQPLHYGKTYKIQAFGIVEFIVSAHRLKLLNFVVRLRNWREERECDTVARQRVLGSRKVWIPIHT